MQHAPWQLIVASCALLAFTACDTTSAEDKPAAERGEDSAANKKDKAGKKGRPKKSKKDKPRKSASKSKSKSKAKSDKAPDEASKGSASKEKERPQDEARTDPPKDDAVADKDGEADPKGGEEEGAPPAEAPDEETLKRDEAKDRRESPDATPQLAKPDTNPIDTLGAAFKDVTSLVVTERNIPFKVLNFTNRTFTIDDPDTIAGFLKAAGADATPQDTCPRCMTTFTVTAKDARGQDRAHLEMYCGGAVSTPLIHNTFTSQCWTVADQPEMKSLLETASR